MKHHGIDVLPSIYLCKETVCVAGAHTTEWQTEGVVKLSLFFYWLSRLAFYFCPTLLKRLKWQILIHCFAPSTNLIPLRNYVKGNFWSTPKVNLNPSWVMILSFADDLKWHTPNLNRACDISLKLDMKELLVKWLFKVQYNIDFQANVL